MRPTDSLRPTPNKRRHESYLGHYHTAFTFHESHLHSACTLPGPLQAAHGLRVLPSAPVDGTQVVLGPKEIFIEMVLPVEDGAAGAQSAQCPVATSFGTVDTETRVVQLVPSQSWLLTPPGPQPYHAAV